MKKKNTTRSAFFYPRFILCLIFCSAGAFLAMLSFGAFSNVVAKPNRSGADYPGGGSAAANRAIGTMTADAGVEDGAPLTPADSNGRFVYLIEFAEPGLLNRPGRAAGERLDMNTAQAKANRDQLMAEQAAHIQAITQAINRTPDVTHRFLATHSGIATRLTQAEAQVVRTLPGVASVARERKYELTTYRGPAFIGASSIWDGTGVPGGTGTRGEGMVIGMLDTGVDSAHPSFANDITCGHGQGGAPNKLITSLDCSSTDGTGLCNGPAPADTDGHGSHTASTAGGNLLGPSAVPPPAPPPPFTEITGVAPCANIRAYRVCPPGGCPGADIQAAMGSILLHGDVDVMNFSISGGTSPWNDNDRRKLDLVEANVLVSASAGNNGADPEVIGRVNHRGPWVMTVAASTRDGDFAGLMSATGPGTPPPEILNIAMIRGSDSPFGDPLTNSPIKHFNLQPPEFEGCTPGLENAPPDMPAFPAGFFTGSVALIHRGNCLFTTKITNAFNAGAVLVVIRNNVPGSISMSTPLQPNVPAYSIDQASGNALVAFVDANPTTSTMNFSLVPAPSDVLADFSLRGPISGTLSELTKPDITGPGVDIYAAVPGSYAVFNGTSMSSPHLAGAATLVRKVHPTWTVSEVKSALMMTAFNGGTKENGTTPWDPDDVGTGRVDLTKTARAGLVMNETFANYLAANPATGGDPKTLNIPSVRDMTCAPSCSWTRTVRNTVAALTTWSATGTAITPGFNITVEPTTFNFNGGLSETQVLTITATPENITAPIAFGEVVLSVSAAGGPALPDHRITVTINGQATPTPTPAPPTPTPGPTGTPGSPTPTPTPTPGGSVTPTPTPNPFAQAVNLSTRLFVQAGDNAAFGGFIITGTAPKQVLIRGIGPSLADFGVPNVLADPTLELFEGTTSIATNNNWRDTQEQAIIDTGIPPTNDVESAVVQTLDPGAYTAVLRGVSNGTGVALVEIYDLTPNSSKMGNISTRGFVDTGDNALIAGVIVDNGVGNDTIVVRGIGPSLADFGVPSPLADPTLELRNGEGTVVRSNNDWQDDQAQADQLNSFGLAPGNALEAGLVESLAPAAYTAILAGASNGTGVGVVEVYDNPQPAGPTATPGPTGTPGPTATPGETPTPTPAAPPCVENFDSVTPPALPPGWTASNPVPGDGVMFVTSTITPDTAPNDAFLPDQDGISDKVLDRTGVTVNSASAVLTFRNNFSTEFSDNIFWDGGVLEVSSPNIANGDFLDVTDSLIGGSITAGGYTGEISGKASNPLAGRMAWSNSSGGYIDSVINLGPNVNGQTITLRWRFGTDELTSAPGWWIDTISIVGASCP